MLTDFLSGVFQFLILYILIRLAWGFHQLHQETKDQNRKEMLEKIEQMIHVVLEEKHGDQYYWFDKDTQQFITQGPDSNAIIENLKKDYTNHVFLINDDLILSGPDWQLRHHKDTKFTIKI